MFLVASCSHDDVLCTVRRLHGDDLDLFYTFVLLKLETFSCCRFLLEMSDNMCEHAERSGNRYKSLKRPHNVVHKSDFHACEAPCCVSLEREHGRFLDRVYNSSPAWSQQDKPKLPGGLCVNVKGVRFVNIMLLQPECEGPGVTGSQRGARRKSMGEGNPFRNLNGLRRKREDYEMTI